MGKRKLCVITGGRAEYGLLSWLMRDIEDSTDFELQLVTTGMHLSTEFGLTYKQIEKDGFKISEKLEMMLASETSLGITKSMGLGLIGFAEVFERLKPNVVILLGDRFEIMVAAQAAMMARIPICHLHGGETTEGAIDESIRHAITKMSHLHFVAADVYRNRVIQMGESPDKVFNVGAMGIESIARIKTLTKAEVEKAIDFKLGDRILMVTYHPSTLSEESPELSTRNLLQALDEFPNHQLIFSLPNSDAHSRIIVEQIQEYIAKNKLRAKAFHSLGQSLYFSLLKIADAVVGNSSSGIIEAPAIGVPTVNIGDRQKGRLMSKSIINCEPTREAICQAIAKTLSSDFRKSYSGEPSIFGKGECSKKILDVIRATDLGSLKIKKFYDIKYSLT